MSKEKLFLLKREISPYAGENLFLGIYDTHELANKQKDSYIESCKTQDKWKEQAYKEVDLAKDVDIIEVQEKLSGKDFPKQGQSLYLVGGIHEGFGQILKELVFISTVETKVKNFLQTKNGEEVTAEDDFMYYTQEELKLNTLVEL